MRRILSYVKRVTLSLLRYFKDELLHELTKLEWFFTTGMAYPQSRHKCWSCIAHKMYTICKASAWCIHSQKRLTMQVQFLNIRIQKREFIYTYWDKSEPRNILMQRLQFYMRWMKNDDKGMTTFMKY
jgi:hypothetical protein